jgi:probable F420-dependent oxidoreductase
MRRPPGLALGLSGLHRAFGPDLRSFVEIARVADEVGIDQVVLSDHVVMGERTDLYPYGKFPFAPEEPWIEPLTALAAMAGATRRVRLGTGILIVPLRPAVLLAKTVASLDVLSGGRVDLGVGVGWQREEFDALGVPFERRWQRTEDTLGACRALWGGTPASFASPTVSFERIHCTPLPAQARIPIWFGAKATEATCERIARLGDGWYPLGNAPREEIEAGAALALAAYQRAGRDPATLGVRAGLSIKRLESGQPDMPRTMEAVPPLVEAGVTLFSIVLDPALRTLPEVRAWLEVVARGFGR